MQSTVEQFREFLKTCSFSKEELREIVKKHANDWDLARKESAGTFPFTQDQVQGMTGEKNHSWLHPLTQISHALLRHFGVVDDPFMLLSNTKSPDDTIDKTGCHCFYATVTFGKDEIIVYDNYGMGGMCPEAPEFVTAIMPYPEWLLPHMPALHQMAVEAMAVPVAEYPAPVPNYTWSGLPAPKKAPQDAALEL